MQFRAAVLVKLNSPLEILTLETQDLKRGQVLVKVLLSGICGSQLHEINGNKGNEKFLPHLMGHEGCGMVESIGEGVTSVKPGDKVIMHWRPGNGIDSDFPTYKYKDKLITSGKVNSLSEYSVCSENRLTAIPDSVPNELAALLGCSLSTSMGIIENEVNTSSVKRLLIIGTGGVGLNLILACKVNNLNNICAFDKSAEKGVLAIKLGAIDFYSEIHSISGDFDFIIDTTGNVENMSFGFQKLAPSGTLLLVGQPNPRDSFEVKNAIKFFNGEGLTIKATQGGRVNPTTDMLRFAQLVQDKNVKFAETITHRYKLNEINEAFSLLKTGLAGRVMIEF